MPNKRMVGVKCIELTLSFVMHGKTDWEKYCSKPIAASLNFEIEKAGRYLGQS